MDESDMKIKEYLDDILVINNEIIIKNIGDSIKKINKFLEEIGNSDGFIETLNKKNKILENLDRTTVGYCDKLSSVLEQRGEDIGL